MGSSDDDRDEVALRRFLLIEDLLDPDLAAEEHQQLFRKILDEGIELPDGNLIRRSRSSIYRYLRAYRDEQVRGLRPRPRSDTGKSRVIPVKVLKRSIELRHTQKKRETRHLIKKLEQEFPAHKGMIKRSTLDRHLALEGASRAQLGIIELKVFRRFEADIPNDLWIGDVMHGDGSLRVIVPGYELRHKVYLISWIDDHSRYLTHSEWYLVERLPSLEDCFKKAILTHGLPGRTYSDKGAIYEARIWKLALAELGVRRVKTRPRAKEAHGKIEKFHQTARSFEREVIDAGIETLHDLNEAWWAYLRVLVHERVHDETKEKPRERFARLKERRYPDVQKLSRLFLVREKRTVNVKFSTVSIRGVAFRVDPMLRGRRVQVRFDPYALQCVFIWHRGREVQVAHPASQGDDLPTPGVTQEQQDAPTLVQRRDARDFLGGLIKEARELDRESLTGLSLTAHHPSEQHYGWTAFSSHLTKLLGRDQLDDFSQAEQDEALRFWRDHGPLNQQWVQLGMMRAIAGKGRRQHLSYYLNEIKIIHFEPDSTDGSARDQQGEPDA